MTKRAFPLFLSIHYFLRSCCFFVLSVLTTTEVIADNSGIGQVKEVEFNDLFLQHNASQQVDVRRFNKGNLLIPGTYRVDLFVNTNWSARTDIRLSQIDGDPKNVQICFDRELLQLAGVDIAKLSLKATQLLTEKNALCKDIGILVPEGVSTFDNSEQRLDLSIPQAYLNYKARGYVDPRYWDDGVPAALYSYSSNIYRAVNQGIPSTQAYLGQIAGVNLGPWRFRHNGNYIYNSYSGYHYQSIMNSMQRSIEPLKSQFIIGEAFTNGGMFDSVGFRGVQLVTDERMYPESQRGYAPTIHGIANSNALVQIYQSGNVIYTANVASGPFEINDIYPTGYGGDLDVVITEASGSTHTFKVPYASTINSLRPGITHFSVTAGQYRNSLVSSTPTLFQATILHGLSNLLTGYGGVTTANGYLAGVVGTALNTKAGAFALDITQANTELPDTSKLYGQSLKLSYSKLISPTNTNIAVAAYRYSSSGYLSLQDAMYLRNSQTNRMEPLLPEGNRRGQLQITLNQSFPHGLGAFYLSGFTANYWNRSGTDTQLQAGYNNNFKRINYGVSASRQFDLTQKRWENRLMMNISIPFDFASHTIYSSTSLQRDTSGSSVVQQAVSGSFGADNVFSYGVNVGRTSTHTTNTTQNVGGNLSYKSPYADLTVNSSRGTGFTQYGAGIAGGMVAYQRGVVFTPTMGETLAIVEAPNASGARVTAGNGLRIDPFGHAVASNLTPFSANEVEIDPKGLPMSVELKSSAQHVTPTAGAVVPLKYEVAGGGRAVIMQARMENGSPVPFGAEIMNSNGYNVGTVAQDGRTVLRGIMEDTGILHVKWGDKAAENCLLPYKLPATDKASKQRWANVEAVCTE